MDCSLKETFVVIIKRRDSQFPSLKWSDHKPTEKHNPNISSSHKFLVVKGNYKWESGLNSIANNSHLIFLPRWAASLCLVHHLLLAIGTAHGGGEVNRNWICEPAQRIRCGEPSFVMGDSDSPTPVPSSDETIVRFEEENVIIDVSPGTEWQWWWWREWGEEDGSLTEPRECDALISFIDPLFSSELVEVYKHNDSNWPFSCFSHSSIGSYNDGCIFLLVSL